MHPSSTGRYRKRPVEIEAYHWLPNGTGKMPLWFLEAIKDKKIHYYTDNQGLKIDTLEGTMTAVAGDWIIKGVRGEIYPCNPEVFDATYDPVDILPLNVSAEELAT